MQNFLGMAEAAGGVPDVGNMAVEHTDPSDQLQLFRKDKVQFKKILV